MSVVRYRVPWRVQPQGAVALNLGYPGAGRITTLIPFGVVNRDIVGNKALTLSSGGSIQPDPRGLTLKGSGSAAVTSLALNLSAYNKLTVSFWGYWDAFANDDKFFGEFTANSNSNNGFYIDPNSSTTNFAIQAGNSTPLRKTAHFPRPSAATWHHYLFTFDTTTGAGSSGLTAYVDGVLQTLTWVNTDNMASSAFANDTMYFFSRNNASLFGAGRMQNFVIRGGYVGTQLDASYEYANGWQLFSPLPRTLWAPAAAGGAYTLTADAGSYSLSGQDAALVKSRIVVADAGSYALAGQDAALLKSKLVTGDAGSYALAGQDAAFVRNRVVTADPGAYTIAGQDATLTYTPVGSTYTLTCDAGAYTLAGQDATLIRGRVVTADAGAYSISGQDATLTYSQSGDLIGRKYPRRGRSRPRNVEQIADVPKALKQVRSNKIELQEELASAQADIVSLELMTHNGVNRAKKITELKGVIDTLEQNIRVMREEETLMLLTLMALEM